MWSVWGFDLQMIEIRDNSPGEHRHISMYSKFISNDRTGEVTVVVRQNSYLVCKYQKLLTYLIYFIREVYRNITENLQLTK